MRALGWDPDPHDDRDSTYGLSVSGCEISLAGSVSLRPYMGDVLNQGHLQSCTAQAVAKGIYANHRILGRDPVMLPSRLAIWYLARAILGRQKENRGCHIRDAFKCINKLGICEESIWPYSTDLGDDAPFRQMPPTEVFRMSHDRRLHGNQNVVYRRLLDDGDDRLELIRFLLDGGFPVIFGTDVSVDFADNKLPSDPIMPPVGEPIAGGHAMIVCGYDSYSFEVLNSWGDGWGDHGYCKLHPDYLTWSRTRDLWVVEAAPV